MSLIGSPLDSYLLTKIKNEVIEAVEIHDRIASIENVVVFNLTNDIFVYFSYLTDDYEFGSSILQVD